MSFKQMLIIIVRAVLLLLLLCVVVLLMLSCTDAAVSYMKWHRSSSSYATHPLLFVALQKLEEIPDAGQSILSLNLGIHSMSGTNNKDKLWSYFSAPSIVRPLITLIGALCSIREWWVWNLSIGFWTKHFELQFFERTNSTHLKLDLCAKSKELSVLIH